MPNDFLDKILDYKRSILERKMVYYQGLKDKVKSSRLTEYQVFKKSISKPGQLNLIAEIKKASPSRGLLLKEFDVLKLARIYVDNGAAAISILTEDKYFLGKPMYTRRVSENFNVPLLTKDFIIDEVQIFEAFCFGASAILLIVAILEDSQLKHLMKVASTLDLDCLVEVHDEKELKRALSAGAEIIGINNRNLKTFEVDTKTCQRLIPMVPKGKIIVAESGIKSHQEIKDLKAWGAHAVLIGETFLTAPDIAQKVKEIMNG